MTSTPPPAASAASPSLPSPEPVAVATGAAGGQGVTVWRCDSLMAGYEEVPESEIGDDPNDEFVRLADYLAVESELAALRSRAAMAGRLAECVELFARYFAENGGDQEYHQADGAGWVTLARAALAEFRKL
jgi:hypothetical protein